MGVLEEVGLVGEDMKIELGVIGSDYCDG